MSEEALPEPVPEEAAPEVPASPPKPPRRPRTPLQRAGCTVALIIWFAILLIPCLLINFAVNGEFVITTGGAPGQQVRLWLISEAYERGVGLSTASVHQSNDPNALCVETSVRFLLWTGQADPSVYCDCYQRASANVDWSQTTTTSSACPA